MGLKISATALVFLLAALTLCMSKSASIQIVKADKVVQLNGLHPTQTEKIEYKCLSDDCGDVIEYTVTEGEYQKILHIVFSRDKTTTQSFSYSTQQQTHNSHKFIVYKINVKKRLHQDQIFVLAVTTTFLNRYINYPQTIDLTEDQKFQYEDNKKYLSSYHVKDATVTYKFSKIIGFQADGEKKGLSGVTFRSSDVQPYTYVPHRVHGVNNEPQIYFSEVIREIQVSHWGNIAITQFYKIKNIGPELKGQFSRVQFSSNNKFEAKNSWKGIQTLLPYEIWGLYYRDQVGNISTSRAFRDDHNENVRLALVPRYALLGGWKANWEIGYNLNTKGFLKHNGNSFQLNKIPVECALSEILAEKYTIKVILPEGASNTKLHIGDKAVDMKTVRQGISFGYLDFAGRPTYTVDNLKGLFPNQKLRVTYELDYMSIFKKPLIVFVAIFSVLVLLITLKRINMSAFEEERVKTH